LASTVISRFVRCEAIEAVAPVAQLSADSGLGCGASERQKSARQHENAQLYPIRHTTTISLISIQ